jgi:hypothetical protein
VEVQRLHTTPYWKFEIASRREELRARLIPDVEVSEGRRQTERKRGNAGSRLNLVSIQEGTVCHAGLGAVLGKTHCTEF